MSARQANMSVFLMVVVATAAGCFVAFGFEGMILGDLYLYTRAGQIFHDHRFEFYAFVNSGIPAPGGWPYPPGYLPWTQLARWLNHHVGGTYAGWFKLPMVLADGAIAWLVQDYLRRRGGSVRARLTTVAMILLGPTFFVIGAYQGYLDAVAILPAVAAVAIWTASDRRHPVICGVLIGLGSAIKTVPILVLLAMLPSARGNRERIWLSGSAAVLLALTLMPFLYKDPASLMAILRYQSLPGFGGLSLLLQPELARNYLHIGQAANPTGTSLWLRDHGGVMTLSVVAAMAVLIAVRRVPPVPAAVLIWLTVYAFGGGFFFQYLVWGIPFFLMAGRRREALLLLLVATVPEAVLFLALKSELYLRVFQGSMIGIYFGLLAAWLRVVTGMWSGKQGWHAGPPAMRRGPLAA